jgi:hypothetical protein
MLKGILNIAINRLTKDVSIKVLDKRILEDNEQLYRCRTGRPSLDIEIVSY